MKKTIVLMFIMIFLCIPICSSAVVNKALSTDPPVPKFNKKELEKNPYYKYDKYKKEWSIKGYYKMSDEDYELSLFLILFDSYVETTSGPELRVVYVDKELGMLLPVTALRVIVGDHLFRFEKPFQSTAGSSVASCSTLIKLCNALVDETAGNIGFQIDYTRHGLTWSKTFENFSETDLTSLKSVAKSLRDSNAWNIYRENQARDAYFQATSE